MSGRLATFATIAAACIALTACGDDRGGSGAGVAVADEDAAEEVVLTPDSVGAAGDGGSADPPGSGSLAASVNGAGRGGKPRRAHPAAPGPSQEGGDRRADRGAAGSGRFGGAASAPDGISPGAPSDAQVRAELRRARAQLARFKRFLSTTAYLQTGPRARVLPDGTAIAPESAPEPVKRIIQAGNAIASLPYKWGGGHATWRDDGYDCSGSVSFALAGAGMLEVPLTSGQFVDWGASGPGEWVTIYTNPGHIFMVVAGLRFDTSGRGRAGTRWQEAPRSTSGFVARSIPGL